MTDDIRTSDGLMSRGITGAHPGARFENGALDMENAGVKVALVTAFYFLLAFFGRTE